MPNLHKMNAGEFARRLRADSEMRDKRFAIFLGAGCSISSSIPGASSLVKDHWLPRLQEFCAPERKDTEVWANEEFPDYDPNNPAGLYGSVMERLFLNPEDRQREIERLCDGKFPGFGYAVLATLIARDSGSFNVVITTNFDDLVSDALYLFTNTRPLVIGHESLAGFIRPTRTRPLVVKLHGDARLSPQNTIAETATVRKEVERQVNVLLTDRALIIIGYGGNDQGIATMLAALPKEALPFGVYWISGSEPTGVLRPWLEERNAIWVEKFDFDEMMLLIRDAFELPHPDQGPFETVFQNYSETFKNLSSRIRSTPSISGDNALKNALDRADEDFKGWQSIASAASVYEDSDPEMAEIIYSNGIERYPNSAYLLQRYAIFIIKIRKDNLKAEQLHQQAINAEPNNASALYNYAIFLHFERKDDYDKAEQLYKRSLEIDPNDISTLRSYAVFLRNIRKDYSQADELYKRALEIAPANGFILSSYAIFLEISLKDYDKAEKYYQLAIGGEYNWDVNSIGNLAGLLLSRGKLGEGYELLDTAIGKIPQMAKLAIKDRGVEAEIWFYAFCHWPEKKRRDALTRLKNALQDGIRSLGWDLYINVERARLDNHSDIKWVELLADVITKDADIKKLDDWQKWREA